MERGGLTLRFPLWARFQKSRFSGVPQVTEARLHLADGVERSESGVGRATISRIERGETGAQGRTLRRLAKALGVGVEELVKVEGGNA